MKTEPGIVWVTCCYYAGRVPSYAMADRYEALTRCRHCRQHSPPDGIPACPPPEEYVQKEKLLEAKDERLKTLMWDVLAQGTGFDYHVDTEIDNMCMSSYEDACRELEDAGYLETENGRIYTFTAAGRKWAGIREEKA